MSSVLRIAAAKDDYLLLERLLDNEYGLEEYTQEEVNEALLRAVANGSVECTVRLLAHGADIDAVDTDGYSALMLATANNFPDVAKLMIDAGCEIDHQSEKFRTALHVAAWGNRYKIIRMLMDAKCDVNLQDEYGDTAVMLAARKGFYDAIRLLLRSKHSVCDVNARSNEKDTALHYTARQGQSKCAKVLMSNGAEKEAKDMWGYTSLLLAAHWKKIDTIEVMVNMGCDVNATDKCGKTPLHHCARNGSLEGANLLLSNGADPNVADYDGYTPLSEAVFNDHGEIAVAFFKYGANPSIMTRGIIRSDFIWCTAMENALLKKNIPLAHMLRLSGCDTRCPTLTSLYPEVLVADENVLHWYETHANVPLKLWEMSRVALRHGFGKRLDDFIKNVPMPSLMKNLLTYKDLDEIVRKSEK